jgi:hypothetical protein
MMGWERNHMDELAIDRILFRVAVGLFGAFLIVVSIGVSKLMGWL